ncbi:MAG: Deoxyguanosinetriphosphate triphosphohydrolase-like protein [Chlamydiae bacterium]|nr:Deoxyguanosinetriphosphate triphosphohydrolase-like protein [Chlamydiota bacterium]
MTSEVKDFLEDYRKEAELKELNYLYHKAAFSKDHSRYQGAENDHRMPYKRDVDRIVHSKAYSRYVDKTQVVYLVRNDHISHRSLHVQLVSNFSRGIAEILRLNLDLVEAIALGHDVGHPPFGHEGEGYLNKISLEMGEGSFAHPAQSCRVYSMIEPLNLGLNVFDGFLCHDGGMASPVVEPSFGKTWERHFEELEQKKSDPNSNILPGTLEGCLVKICDTMSYLGRDIEDAISLGILTRSDVPDWEMGSTNREILSYLAQDVIRNSYEKDYIAMSERAYELLKELRKFNFEKIYNHPKLKVESDKIRNSYRIFFQHLLDDYKKNGESSYLWSHFLYNKDPDYYKSASAAQLVIDYISGMTDNYFVRTLETIFVPTRIEL